MADWKKIKAEYIKGGISYRKLAEKHGVSPTTLTKVAIREGWNEARHHADTKGTARVIDAVSKRQAEKACNIIDVADMLIDKIIEIVKSDAPQSTQSIKSLTSALKDLKDIKGYKSEIDLKEQEARIAKLQREAQQMSGDEDDDNTGVLMLPEADAPLIDKEESRE